MLKNPVHRRFVKRFLFAAGILLFTGIAVYIYYATRTHKDTSALKAEFAVDAGAFIREFENDINAANKKFANKIVAINGIVSEKEAADTSINIKMTDNATGSYIIFAFQKRNMEEAKNLQPGDIVTIKGVCSDGVFSEILQKHFISLTRSVIEKINP
jgi:hypothetical protein